jgi:hypothetical protein
VTGSLDQYLRHQASLVMELTQTNAHGERRIPLALPSLPADRDFEGAWLVLPKDFPGVSARVQLSKDAVLRVPHVDSDGNLCFSGDAGPASGASSEERLDDMLFRFWEEFFVPWLSGALDGDFEKETANYWAIHIVRHASNVDAMWRVYTTDGRHSEPRILDARLLQPSRVLVVGDNAALASRLIGSLGQRAAQVSNVVVADIPIDYPFTPTTWPSRIIDVEDVLQSRLSESQRRQFDQTAHRRTLHRLVLFRAPTCSYAYLLPGGPPTLVVKRKTKRAYPTRHLLPLAVERLDPNWTCGRDQHLQVSIRQQCHVLVLGAGALGGVVVDQLARAGVGKITVVDPDFLSAPNIGRHLLGADTLGLSKARGVASHVGRAVPSCQLAAFAESAGVWLMRHTLAEVSIVLDLTGEPDVRAALETARLAHPRPLLIGWLEPFVAAAHACVLRGTDYWLNGAPDRMEALQAVDWPDNVLQHEPGCSSQFQSYTQVAATYGVAAVSEAALALIDGEVVSSHVRSWVRGQRFIDTHHPGMALREWAKAASEFDGVLLQRSWS